MKTDGENVFVTTGESKKGRKETNVQGSDGRQRLNEVKRKNCRKERKRYDSHDLSKSWMQLKRKITSDKNDFKVLDGNTVTLSKNTSRN